MSDFNEYYRLAAKTATTEEEYLKIARSGARDGGAYYYARRDFVLAVTAQQREYERVIRASRSGEVPASIPAAWASLLEAAERGSADALAIALRRFASMIDQPAALAEDQYYPLGHPSPDRVVVEIRDGMISRIRIWAALAWFPLVGDRPIVDTDELLS